MKKIDTDLTMVIEELDALAEVLIPSIDLNDIRREREEYVAQTASDLYDRVVYMVRSHEMEEGDDPQVKIEMRMGPWCANRETWLPSRRERQEWLKKSSVEMLRSLEKARDYVERDE